MTDQTRQLNYTIEAFERTVERVQAEMRQENAQARQANTGEIARLGVRLNELTDKIDDMFALSGALKDDIRQLQQQSAHEASERPERQRSLDKQLLGLAEQIGTLADSHEQLRQWLYLWLAVVSGAALVLLGLLFLITGLWWSYGR